jgi:hypothetical protein
MNDDLKEVTEETFFKIVFSEPAEMDLFKEWIRKHDGEYNYNKDESKQEGTFPKVPMFHDEICWCDIMTYYLLHVAGYSFHSTIDPYKGEVYFRESTPKSAAAEEQALNRSDMQFTGGTS